MANKMGIIHYFLIKIETEGKTIHNYELHINNYISGALMYEEKLCKNSALCAGIFERFRSFCSRGKSG